MTQVEGLKLTGELVANLKDKRLAIGAVPVYEEIPDLQNPEKKVRKLKIVSLIYQDRSVMDYYPNKTSVQKLANLFGTNLDNWTGKMFEVEVLDQVVSGNKKKVIYVLDKKVEIPKEKV